MKPGPLQRRTPLKRGGPLRRRAPLRTKPAPAGSSIPAGGRAPKRSAPIRPASRKTAERDRLYRQLRSVFIGAGDRCVAGGRLPVVCDGLATDVHHTMGRSARYMLNVATWARLCRPCHLWVTDHPAEARRLGLSRHRRGDPPPMTSHVQTCRACTALMYYATTEAGASMPLIVDPETRRPAAQLDDGKAGRIQVVEAEQQLFAAGDPAAADADDLTVRVLSKGEPANPDFPVWLSHFVDCPYSAQFQKGRAR